MSMVSIKRKKKFMRTKRFYKGPKLKEVKRMREVQKKMKQGIHPQQWRIYNDPTGVPISGLAPSVLHPVSTIKKLGAGANLGAMGGLGDVIIFEIYLSEIGYQIIWNQMIPGFTLDFVIRNLNNILYIPVRTFLENKLKAEVPQDTGELLESLLDSLKPKYQGTQINTISRELPFRLSLGTKVGYAAVVERMPSDWIVHPGTHGVHGVTAAQKKRRTYSSKTGLPLFDPTAKAHPFDRSRRTGQLMAERRWDNNFIPLIHSILQRIIPHSRGQKYIDLIKSAFGLKGRLTQKQLVNKLFKAYFTTT